MSNTGTVENLNSSTPLLSVIVPVYNTGVFLSACLDSILSGTYTNLEVIVVNDGTQDNSEDIILEYQNRDSRIKYVCNPSNQGLFAARLRGYEVATGEYICSVDSDDAVGVDYHRVMMKKALETAADIVVSKFVIKRVEENAYYYRTLGNYAIEDIDLHGEDILLDFFQTQGTTSHRFLVWNKIYKKSLWDECYSDLLLLTRHLVMLEDFIYGVHFISKARRYVSVDCDAFFYSRHNESSTTPNREYDKFEKYINDIVFAMNFVKDYLRRIGRYEDSLKFLVCITNRWCRIWIKDINNASKIRLAQKNYLIKLLNSMCETRIIEKDVDSFFYREHTVWDNRYEKLKKEIIDSSVKYVSFDIFDTLIVRPFFEPKDLFHFLNPEFHKLTKRDFESFFDIRVSSEKIARRNLSFSRTNRQDVTLDEIYKCMQEHYCISSDSAEQLKMLEINLELKFCFYRKSMKELYELAIHIGKPVICISDMYLPLDVIEKILKKNGYNATHSIFVSCEVGLSKAEGDLFRYAVNSLRCSASEILHIGDNWDSDILKARNNGLRCYFTPSSMSLLLNQVPDYNKKKARSNFSDILRMNTQGNYIGFFYAKDSLPIRCMIALSAQRIFDNPFASYAWHTNWNLNPYYIGYFALGMHDFGIAKWIYDEAMAEERKIINFVARDGYMVKKIYDILSKYLPNPPKSNYVYISRKSLLPLFIVDKDSLYSVFNHISYKNYTAGELLLMLSGPIDYCYERDKEKYKKKGIYLDATIKSEAELVNFVQAVQIISYCDYRVKHYRTKMKTYFEKELGDNNVMFDIGYSGRTSVLLTKLLGRPVDTYYIHNNGDNANKSALQFGFKITTFFGHRPSITGKMRELIQSEIGPSCIGYDEIDNDIVPVFEKSDIVYQERFMLERMHQGAIDFTVDFLNVFGDYINGFALSATEVSIAHEFFLHSPAPKDTGMFSPISFEDDMLAGYVNRPISDIWWEDLKRTKLISVATHHEDVDEHLKKLSLWYLWRNQRDDFRVAVWLKLQNHKTLFRLTRKAYRLTKHVFYRKPAETKPHKPVKLKYDVLYVATSSYNLLCSCLHKMLYNADKPCICLLSNYRESMYINLKSSGIFDDTVLFDDRGLRSFTIRLSSEINDIPTMSAERSVFKEVESRLPFNLSKFKEIYVGNDTMPIGAFIVSRILKYNIFEDAAGLYSQPLPLEHSINENFPFIEKHLIEKYKTLNRNKYVKSRYINMSAQHGDYSKKNVVNFNTTELLKKLTSRQLVSLLSVFGAKKIPQDNSETYNLILTYPLKAREGLTAVETQNVYLQFADFFAYSGKVHIKPHPDDREDYSRLFTDEVVIEKTVISELLPFITGVRYKNAITAVSMSLGNLTENTDYTVKFGVNFKHYFKDLYKYYAAAKIIAAHAKAAGYESLSIHIGEGLFEEALKNMLCYSDIECRLPIDFTIANANVIVCCGGGNEHSDNSVLIIRIDDSSITTQRTYYDIQLKTNRVYWNSTFSVSNAPNNVSFTCKRDMKHIGGELEIAEKH